MEINGIYDYLEHHGVEGQHWGVRNGPPYPLNRRRDARLRTKEFTKNAFEYANSVGRSREYEKKITKYEKKDKTDKPKYEELVQKAKEELKTQKMIELQQRKILKNAKSDGYVVENMGPVKIDVRKPMSQILPGAMFGIPGFVIDWVITYHSPLADKRTVTVDSYKIKAPKK